MKISSSTHIKILFLAFLSCGLKTVYFIYKYNYGFLENDYARVAPDEYGYLMKGMDGFTGVYFGQHWVYELLNILSISVFKDGNTAYIMMCLFNIFLSLLLPYSMLPMIRSISVSNERYNKIFLSSAIIFFLMPSAIWLAASNLKDMLLAVFNFSFVSLFILLSEEKRNIRRLIIIISLFALGFLVFSLRSYLAVILLIALVIQLFFKTRHKIALLIFFLCIGVMIVYSIGIQNSLLFVESWVSWLYNPDAAEIIAQQIAETGENEFIVNYAFRDILLQIGKFYFGPFPALTADIWENIIISIQSGLLFFFLIPLMVSFKSLLSHKNSVFFVSYILLLVAFYSVAAQYSGYRQRFATLDFFTVLFIVRFYYTEGGKKIHRARIPSILIGCILNIALILFTARSNL